MLDEVEQIAEDMDEVGWGNPNSWRKTPRIPPESLHFWVVAFSSPNGGFRYWAYHKKLDQHLWRF